MINPLKRIEETRYTLHHPNLPRALSGLTLTQISDIHMGRWVKPHHIRQLVSHVNAQSPDLIALTGDYVGYNKEDLKRCAVALSGLDARAFAVLGNHDHWANSKLANSVFAHTPIALLSNETVPFVLCDGAPAIHIIGVDDHVTGHADVAQAFASRPGDDAFALTLNHVPSIAPDCAKAGADLILSGHTHNFQFNIPRFTHRLAKQFGVQYYAGTYRIDDAILYINRGLGSASWPWRIRALPELTHITLEHGERPVLEFKESTFFGVD